MGAADVKEERGDEPDAGIPEVAQDHVVRHSGGPADGTAGQIKVVVTEIAQRDGAGQRLFFSQGRGAVVVDDQNQSVIELIELLIISFGGHVEHEQLGPGGQAGVEDELTTVPIQEVLPFHNRNHLAAEVFEARHIAGQSLFSAIQTGIVARMELAEKSVVRDIDFQPRGLGHSEAYRQAQEIGGFFRAESRVAQGRLVQGGISRYHIQRVPKNVELGQDLLDNDHLSRSRQAFLPGVEG